jgi:ABC-2 type transport system permease protein
MRAVMAKEFIQLLRDRTTFSMIVMIPIMQLLLFGYAINTDPKHLPAALLIQDNSVFARSFTRGLENSEYFKIARVASEKEADLLMQQGRVQFIINIPENFGRDIVRGVRPAVLIEADASDPVAAAGALAAASGVLPIVLAHDLTGPLATLKGKPEAVELRLQRRYNPEGFTRYNIIPGLVGVILTMTGVMMTALAITRERERGTMETLLSMPIHPSEVMAGKILPYIIIGYLQAFIIIITAGTLFGVPIHGSLGLLCLALLIFISCNLAIGFTLSAGAQNQMQATQLSMMVTLPSFMLSGFIFPFYGMPQWAQILGNIIPATHFIRITRGILLKGSGFSGVWPDIWPMLIFLVAATVFAMKRYRRTLD